MKRIDDLQFKGLVLVQDDDGYCFTTDAVLLANFVKTKSYDMVVELCAGTGVISTLIAGKQTPKKIMAVELQEKCCELFKESIKLNGQEKVVEVLNLAVQDLEKHIKTESASVVVVNPPYYKKEQAQNKNQAIAISTHEIALTIDDVINESARLLKYGGKFYMVHHIDRLVEILCKMSKAKLEPKQLRFVQPKPNTEANLVLIEAVKGGKTGLKVKDVLIFRDQDGEESKEVKEIYGRLK